MTNKGPRSVEVLQSLLQKINVGLEPSKKELKEARELGIDVDELMEIFKNEQDTYLD